MRQTLVFRLFILLGFHQKPLEIWLKKKNVAQFNSVDKSISILKSIGQKKLKKATPLPDTPQDLLWLKTLSITCILIGRYNHFL